MGFLYLLNVQDIFNVIYLFICLLVVIAYDL